MRPWISLLVGLVVCAGWFARPRVAWGADPEVTQLLDQAQVEKGALRYADARATLGRARRLGRSGPAELAAIFRLGGELAAGLGEPDVATLEFERWLSLVPDATLPEGTSPKITAPFAAARAWLDEHGPLRVRFEPAAATASSGPSLTLVIESDPLGLVAGARARVRAPRGLETAVEGRGAGRIVLVLPAAAPLEIVASAIDELGNELVVHGSWEVPITIGAPAGAAQATGAVDSGSSRPSWIARWTVWGGAGVLFGAAGVVFGLETRGAQSDLDAVIRDSRHHSFDDATAIEDRGRRDALFANVAFGAAGVAAVVATLLFVYERPESSAPTVIVPTAAPGGAGLALHGWF